MTTQELNAKIYAYEHSVIPTFEDSRLTFADFVYRGLIASLALASVNAFALMIIVIRLAL